MKFPPNGDYLLQVDASSYFHRAYHALPKAVLHSTGKQIGAVYGFCWSMMKLFYLNRTAIGRLPRYGAIVMDSRGRNFRHDLYPDYKANRPPYEDGLLEQLEWIPRVAKAFNVPCIAAPGYEADDIIATLTAQADRDDLLVCIASSDKDLMQLVNTQVYMYDAMKDRDEFIDGRRVYVDASVIDIDGVRDKWGVFPWQIADLLALTGDAADNIPGIHKVGPKTAATLINTIGDLDRIVEEADWSPESFPTKKVHENVVAGLDNIPLARQLVALDENVPLEHTIDDLWLGGADRYELIALFEELEMPQLVKRVDQR